MLAVEGIETFYGVSQALFGVSLGRPAPMDFATWSGRCAGSTGSAYYFYGEEGATL